MPAPRLKSPLDSSPVPHDLESRTEFETRFLTHPRMQDSALPVYKRHKMVEKAWKDAKTRSRVSVRTSKDEWLMFD